MLYRIDKGILDGYTAKLVILKIGTNNLYGDFNAGSEAEIADGIKACVEKIRQKQPKAQVLLLGILPRQNSYFIGRIDKINAIIGKLDDGDHVHYLDIGPAFIAPDRKGIIKNLYKSDELHLLPPGYEVFMKQIHDKVAELVAT